MSRSAFPFECTFFPAVHEGHQKRDDERQHRREAHPAEPFEEGRPGVDEDDLYVEDDEEDRREVEFDAEFGSAAAFGVVAALERGHLFRGWVLRTKERTRR